MEKDHFPSFLDIDIYRRLDGFLGHKVYWKPTHTNLYQKLRSHHHSSNIQAVLSALVHRARALGDGERCHDELEFLMTTWRDNGCSLKEIQHALNPSIRTSKSKDKPIFHSLSICPTTYGWLSRCWQNATSQMLAWRLGRSLASSVQWRTAWNWGLWGIWHTMCMWPGVHWTDCLIVRYQNKGAPHTHMARRSRQFSSDGTQV